MPPRSTPPLWSAHSARPDVRGPTGLCVIGRVRLIRLGGSLADHRFAGSVIANQVAAHQPDDAIEVFYRGELERQLALPLAKVDPHTGVETVREPGGLAVQLRVVRTRARLAGTRSPFIPERNDLFDVAYRQSLGRDPLREVLHSVTVLKSEQSPSVTSAQHPRRNTALNRRREFEQAQGVGDLRA